MRKIIFLAIINFLISGCANSSTIDKESTSNLASVTVVIDYSIVIKDLLNQFGEQSWCDAGLDLMNTRGGQGINLKIEGEEPIYSGKLVPSLGNDSDLPCQFEAVIAGVPTGKQFYYIEQVGGKTPILAAKTKLTGEELQAKGNIVIIQAP